MGRDSQRGQQGRPAPGTFQEHSPLEVSPAPISACPDEFQDETVQRSRTELVSQERPAIRHGVAIAGIEQMRAEALRAKWRPCCRGREGLGSAPELGRMVNGRLKFFGVVLVIAVAAGVAWRSADQ